MPTEVIRKGKSYLEYSPQEIAAHRLEKEIRDMQKNGQRFFAASTFDSPVNTNPTGKRFRVS